MSSVIKRLIILCVSMLLVVSGTFAWLSYNRKVDVAINEKAPQLDSDGVIIDSYRVLQYDYENDRIVNAFNPTEQYELTAYDSIFSSRNARTILIFEVKLYNFKPSSSEFTIYVQRKHCDSEFNSKENRFTSNLIWVCAATEGTLEIDSSDAIDVVYENVSTSLVQKNIQKQTFITVSGNNMSSSTDTIVIPVSLTESEKSRISSVETGRNEFITAYFAMDYDTTLVEAQRITGFNDIKIFDNRQTAYLNDIEMIMFKE